MAPPAQSREISGSPECVNATSHGENSIHSFKWGTWVFLSVLSGIAVLHSVYNNLQKIPTLTLEEEEEEEGELSSEWGELSSEQLNVGRVVFGRVFFGASCLRGELSVIQHNNEKI